MSQHTSWFLPRDTTICSYATYGRLSVVRLSVTFSYADHIGWNTSKITK